MTRRDRWRMVLDGEVARWSAMTAAEIGAALPESSKYEVEREGIAHQVDVLLLEDTEEYLHVLLSVDDGTLPASMVPVSVSFIAPKTA